MRSVNKVITTSVVTLLYGVKEPRVPGAVCGHGAIALEGPHAPGAGQTHMVGASFPRTERRLHLLGVFAHHLVSMRINTRRVRCTDCNLG